MTSGESKLPDTIFRATAKLRRTLSGSAPLPTFHSFEGSLQDVDTSTSDVADIFRTHGGRLAHKWVHYLDTYDQHLTKYRNSCVRMLEIGVSYGGSLEMWRTYLGPSATIFGIDINPDCAFRVDAPNQVRIGSQDDPTFLLGVVQEMGGIDLVLDDGSHIGRHQLASFKALWPLLPEGGLYIIEDMQTAYWPGLHEGGFRRRGTAVEFVKTLVDDMHHWYHNQGGLDNIGAIHFYDSMAFIEKRTSVKPKHVSIGHK